MNGKNADCLCSLLVAAQQICSGSQDGSFNTSSAPSPFAHKATQSTSPQNAIARCQRSRRDMHTSQPQPVIASFTHLLMLLSTTPACEQVVKHLKDIIEAQAQVIQVMTSGSAANAQIILELTQISHVETHRLLQRLASGEGVLFHNSSRALCTLPTVCVLIRDPSPMSACAQLSSAVSHVPH